MSLLLGLVGAGIGGSLAKPLHEGEGAAAGLPIRYRPMDADVLGFGVDDLADVLTWAERFGFDGLNVTHPFKQAVLPLLDERSEAVDALGAANTIVLRDGRRSGYNTDWSGFAQSLTRSLPSVAGQDVVLLGAGGAGAAVGYALARLGARSVVVHDLDPRRAEACVQRLATVSGTRFAVVDDLAAAVSGAGGLVNATPTGMRGHPGLPLPAGLVHPHLWVADVVYFPLQTELTRLAAERGCTVVTGGGMAVFQAVGAFELFTGRGADPERMRAHFDALTTVASRT